MAELRLAMLGMGKAMSGYLASSDQQGLEKVKDGLLGAGGGDLEELVKEWAWHEGLERTTVNGHGQDPSTPILQEAPKSAVPTMGTLNTPRGYPSPVPSPSPIPSKPPLTLSSRADSGPLTSLSRVPQTAPLARPHPQSSPHTTMSASTEQPERQEADPLGNLGISQIVSNRQHQTKSASSGDPLGVGPL
jgi:TBC1 domain family protein 5